MKLVWLVLFTWALAACGTVSGVQSPDSSGSFASQDKNFTLQLRDVDTVVIGTFHHDSFAGTTERPDSSSVFYSDLLASTMAEEIKKKDLFSRVVSLPGQGAGQRKNGKAVDTYSVSEQYPHAVLIDGTIMHFDEGNVALRGFIGLGAGQSAFDAKIYIKDPATGQVLGIITARKKSWALGGLIAASQDVKSHIKVVARKVAAELEKAKQAD